MVEPSASFFSRARRDIKRNRLIYLMALPILAYYIIFHYAPMYGVLIAFKDYSPSLGILGSPFVGLKWFREFFGSYYFTRLLRNTLLISIYSLLWGFPAPILFALLINEVRNKFFKKAVQTITYMPYFMSLVVVCGILVNFTSSTGVITGIVEALGGPKSNLLANPNYFRTIYVASGIWQNIGWGSIIYLAALSGIDPALYEAATIDGAKRFRQILHITLPGIMPTIIILLILNVGNIMSVGFEKIILLYSPPTYETADVISTFVYRKGIVENNYAYSSAIGLFNSVINFLLVIAANKISTMTTEVGLW
ncbi:ABC transporter permease subunit [Ruminococcaceae bacterium OttesenSCG-928-L11]|nr:ABC transporter permease subunit [Ruminococcaceae bacterium OttesenSCG-928-L11]